MKTRVVNLHSYQYIRMNVGGMLQTKLFSSHHFDLETLTHPVERREEKTWETSLNSESSSALSGWLHVKTLYICLVLHKGNRLCFSLLSGLSILLCYNDTGVK